MATSKSKITTDGYSIGNRINNIDYKLDRVTVEQLTDDDLNNLVEQGKSYQSALDNGSMQKTDALVTIHKLAGAIRTTTGLGAVAQFFGLAA